MNRTLSVGLAFAFIIAAAAGAFFISGQKKPAERKPIKKVIKQVNSLPVRNSSITTNIEITGRLQAKQKVELFAEVGGTFLPNGNRFKEGKYFQKGQTIIKIDNEEQKLSLLAQKSSLMNQITLMLPDLKSDYPESFPAWEAYVKNLDVNEPLTALPSPVSDQEKYFVSARNLYNLYYTIQSQEKRMQKYTISAPFNGVISTASIDEGTLVRVGQKLGELMNTYTYELEAAVYEQDIDLIKVGSQVNLFTENKAKSWKGTVSRIS